MAFSDTSESLKILTHPDPVLHCRHATRESRPPIEKLEHQLESLGAKVEADMRVSQAQREQAKAENETTLSKNESAIERLLASNAEFRANMEKSVNSITTSITTRLMIGLAISVAFLSLVVAFTGVFLRS